MCTTLLALNQREEGCRIRLQKSGHIGTDQEESLPPTSKQFPFGYNIIHPSARLGQPSCVALVVTVVGCDLWSSQAQEGLVPALRMKQELLLPLGSPCGVMES